MVVESNNSQTFVCYSRKDLMAILEMTKHCLLPLLAGFHLPNAILSILPDPKLWYQILIPKFMLASWIRVIEIYPDCHWQ